MLPSNFPGKKGAESSIPFVPTPLRYIQFPKINVKNILREVCLILTAGVLTSIGFEAIYYGLTHHAY